MSALDQKPSHTKILLARAIVTGNKQLGKPTPADILATSMIPLGPGEEPFDPDK